MVQSPITPQNEVISRGFRHLSLSKDGAFRALPLMESLAGKSSTFDRHYVFFPATQETIGKYSKADEQKMALAHRKLFTHVYQSICSLMFAIANVDIVRKIAKSTELIEAANKEYIEKTTGDFAWIYRRDEGFEEGVENAKRICAQAQDIVKELAKHPDNHELCQKISDLSIEFWQTAYNKVHGSSYHVRYSNELIDNIPAYSIYLDSRQFSSYQEFMSYLSEGTILRTDIMGMGFQHAHVGDLSIRLEPNARYSTTFNSYIPKRIPYEVPGVGLSVEGANTCFAPVFQTLESRLRDAFETIEVEHNGALVFCPKMEFLESQAKAQLE